MKTKDNRDRKRPWLFHALAVLGLALAGMVQAQPDTGAGRALQSIDRQRRFDELQQLQIDNRLRANEDVPIGQRALIDYGAYITAQYFSIDDRNANNHTLWQPEFVAYGRANLDAANEVFARFRASYMYFSPGDSFDGHGNRWTDFDLERGYYRFDLAKYEGAYKGKSIPYNFTGQVGRDLVYWANGLTLGEVLDGGIGDVTWGNLSLELIAGVTPTRTVDFDTSRPNFDHNTRRGFYGGMLTWNPDTPGVGKHHPYVYGVVQQDYNTFDFLAQGNIRTRFDYNSYYIGWGSTGSLTDHLVYGLEMVYEGGDTLSNSFALSGLSLLPIKQRRDNIQAGAADFKLDYLVNDSRNTRLSFEVLGATGDPNRGNSSTTFNGIAPGKTDHSFNAFGLVNSGLAFAPEISNLGFIRLGASTYPFVDVRAFRRMQTGVDFFFYEKLQKTGAFSERTNNRHALGVEPDLYLNWQISSDVTLAARYGVFIPSNATLVTHTQLRQFVYAGVTFAF
jgi:hypothetical protein